MREDWMPEEWDVYNEDMAQDDREREEEEKRAWEWWERAGYQSEDHAEQMACMYL